MEEKEEGKRRGGGRGRGVRRRTREGSTALFANESGSAIFVIKDALQHQSTDLHSSHPSRNSKEIDGRRRLGRRRALRICHLCRSRGRLSLGTLAWAVVLGGFLGPESQLGRRFTEQDRVATLCNQGKGVRG